MDGENDGAAAQAQVAGQQAEAGDQAAQAQVAADRGGSGGEGGDALARARAEYEAALKERDERIAALEGEIAEAAAEPWLFGAGAAAPAQAGATGLPNAGAATDEGAQMRRWRAIAGIDDEEE